MSTLKPRDEMRALLARTPSRVLVTSLLAVDAIPPSPEINLVRGMTLDELEQRYPAAGLAVEAAFDGAEDQIAAGGNGEVDYVAVLVAALPSEATA